MIEFTQIGWFDPGSKRFCYIDEKEYDESQGRNRLTGYTHPVFSIDPETAGRLSVQIKDQEIYADKEFMAALEIYRKFKESYWANADMRAPFEDYCEKQIDQAKEPNVEENKKKKAPIDLEDCIEDSIKDGTITREESIEIIRTATGLRESYWKMHWLDEEDLSLISESIAPGYTKFYNKYKKHEVVDGSFRWILFDCGVYA